MSIRTQILSTAALALAATSALASTTIEATYTIPFNTYSFGLQSGANSENGGAVVINGLRTGGVNDTFDNSIPTAFSTFCVEVGESVQVSVAPFGSAGPTAYTHTVTNLLGSTTNLGGFSGPVTFDAARTTNMRRLFGAYYPSITQSDAQYSAAFQLAVWEIAFDTGLDLNSGSGLIVTSGDAGAIALSQSFLNFVATDTSYGTDLYLLSNPGVQDLITIVPTPGSVALLGMGGLMAARRRR
jgi:hypothetical protein